MAEITLRWRGGERTFGSDRPITVGRAAECDVLVLDERVSRNPHLEVRFERGVWILEDKSSGGTWSNGERVQIVSVPAEHTFQLGAADGPDLTVAPVIAPVVAAGAPSPATSAGAGDPVAPGEPVAPVDPPAPAAVDPGAALLEEAARLAAEPGPADAAPVMAPPTAPPTMAPPSMTAPPPTGAPPPTPAPPPTAPPPMAPPPGQAPRFDPSQTVALDDRALRLTYDDREIVIPPGYAVTIGRDPSCDLTIDSQIVSRQHARFTHDGTHWQLEDLGSTRGTFIDGKRVAGRRQVEGVFEVSLGDDTAGERVRVVTAGDHTVPKSRTALVIASLAFIVALLGIGTTVVLNSGDDAPTPQASGPSTTAPHPSTTVGRANDGGPNSEQELATVKGSTVLIEAIDEDGFGLWTGSGTVITERGDILTNAHVADPGAHSLDALEPLLEGLGDTTAPAGFVIYVSPSEDAPAVPRYFAEWVASSRTQDASIIEVTEDFDTGEPVDHVPMPPIEIGSSNALRAGQRIHSLGYPANATTRSISVKEGEVVSFVSAEEFEQIVGGDNRKVMNTSAVLGQGSSGGPIARGGKIVGINATLNTGDGLDRGWAVPISELDDLLAEVGLSSAD